MTVSIIMPTYNKLPRLKLTLVSLRKSLREKGTEIIVVDDGSTDGPREYLAQLSNNECLRSMSTDRQGRASARNTAVTFAKGDILLFCDDDILVTDDYVQKHIEAHKSGSSLMVHNRIMSLEYLRYFWDPTTGTPFPNYRNYEFNRLKSKCIQEEDIIKRFDEKISNQAKRLYMDKIIEFIFNHQLETSFGWLSSTGTCVSMIRRDFEEIGGFNLDYGLNWGGEDFDLGYRFSQYGGLFKYLERTAAYHIAHYREENITLLKNVFQQFYTAYGDENIFKASQIVTREKPLEYLLQ